MNSVNQCKLDYKTIVAEPPADFNADSKQRRIKNISPKKEEITLDTFDEYGLTSVTAPTGEQTAVSNSVENLELEIAENNPEIDPRLNKAEDPDATEFSSSFADTTSDTDPCNGISEAEVESHFFGDSNLVPAYDAFSSMFHLRKKKLTNHWRSFIRPLMWRCKWTELRIKEIDSRATKYSRELEAYDQAKLPTIDVPIIEMYGSKSMPYSNPCYRRKAAKRRKRKKVEDASDMASYLSTHCLFSYTETKRSISDGIALADDFGVKDPFSDPKNRLDDINDQSLFEHRDGDSFLEQILLKIELAHSQVHKLKTQLDLLVSKHTAKYSSSENLSLLAAGEAHTSSAPSPTFSAVNGDAMSIGAIYNSEQHISEHDMEDLVLPHIAISSFGEEFHVPDIIESTVGLLSAADVTFHDPQIGDSCEDIVDNVFIHNEAAEAERHTFMRPNHQPPLEKIHEPEKCEEEGESSRLYQIPPPERDDGENPVGTHEQSALESCLGTEMHIPRNKRKRGERRAGSWCKKHSSDPESQ